MIKYIGIVITGVLTSLFLFPFQFQGLPGNTKMYLAAILMCLYLVQILTFHLFLGSTLLASLTEMKILQRTFIFWSILTA